MSFFKFVRAGTSLYFKHEIRSLLNSATGVCVTRAGNSQNISSAAADNIVRSPFTSVRVVQEPITELLFNNFKNRGENIAVVCGITGRSFTYNQLEDKSKRFGSALLRKGLKKRDVIGILSPNTPEYPLVFLGAAGIGVTVTTLNPNYTADEVRNQLLDCNASMLVTLASFSSLAKEAVKGVPSVKEVISIGAAEGCTTFEKLLEDSGSLYPSSLDINPSENVLCLPYSSGTTGKPKGVMLSHSAVGTNVLQYTHPDSAKIRFGEETFLGVLPFFHIYGMVMILFSAMMTGSKLVTLPKFEPGSLLKVMAEHKPTFFHIVPPILNFLVSHSDVTRDTLKSLRTAMCAAAPVSPTLASALVNKVANPEFAFQEAWGMTETGPLGTIEPWKNPLLGKAGVPLPNTEMKVVDLNTGAALGPDQDGEMMLRGPQVMLGYHNNPAATASTLESDGWLHTGDIARYDKDGHFQIVDRLKELIKVKGFQVAPAELEDLLLSHPGVRDAAVIGVPHEQNGEVPRAYVVRHGTSVSEQALASFIAEKTTRYKHLLGGVVFVDALPKTPTGKILRKDLRKLAQSER